MQDRIIHENSHIKAVKKETTKIYTFEREKCGLSMWQCSLSTQCQAKCFANTQTDYQRKCASVYIAAGSSCLPR